jgi:hypothetical protein
MRCRRFTIKDAQMVMGRIRLPRGFSLHQLVAGMNVEREHADVTRCSPLLTARIAAAHIRERSDYYQRLRKVEG